MPGRITEALSQAGVSNPLMLLDEIDKTSSDYKGDTSAALLEVLDPEQNSHFSDHYLNLEFDLSKVLFICTANQLESIPGPLQDRLEIISLPGYTEQEKLAIAKKYLLPRQIKENGLKKDDIRLADTVLAKIIRDYTREAGLRALEREMGKLCRKLARRKAEGEKGPFAVSAVQLPKVWGFPVFRMRTRRKHFCRGSHSDSCAWTQPAEKSCTSKPPL